MLEEENFFKRIFVAPGKKTAIGLESLKPFHFPGRGLIACLLSYCAQGIIPANQRLYCFQPGGTVTQKNGQQELWAFPGLAT